MFAFYTVWYHCNLTSFPTHDIYYSVYTPFHVNTATTTTSPKDKGNATVVVVVVLVVLAVLAAGCWWFFVGQHRNAGPNTVDDFGPETIEMMDNPMLAAAAARTASFGGGSSSSSSRRDTVVTRQAGIIYAIPVDEGGDDPGGYAVPLDNYAIAVNNQQSGGGSSSNHEYAIPQARTAPLLPLDLDGYVIDDTSPESTGGGRGDVGGRQSEGTPAAYGSSVHGPESSDI